MNVKRMEVMLEDLNENFDRHVTLSQENFYFVMTAEDGVGRLNIRVYCKDGDVELETLAIASCDVSFSISVDNELVDERVGAITIAPLKLAKGWHTIGIVGQGVFVCRVRITGSITQASVLQ